MRAFTVALCLLTLLVGAVVGLSLAGKARITALEEMLPAEAEGLTEADAALTEFITRVEESRLLLGLLYSHERLDDLLTAAKRTAAATRSGEEGEYALLLAELRGLLRALARDLTPSITDVL